MKKFELNTGFISERDMPASAAPLIVEADEYGITERAINFHKGERISSVYALGPYGWFVREVTEPAP